ncbi:hypothetical protein B0H13DRAFT_1882310 [Mycena leptocephala]|nr:hypothetical protein B0H13DRAFT_1882310 [Mycena leptocephala]
MNLPLLVLLGAHERKPNAGWCSWLAEDWRIFEQKPIQIFGPELGSSTTPARCTSARTMRSASYGASKYKGREGKVTQVYRKKWVIHVQRDKVGQVRLGALCMYSHSPSFCGRAILDRKDRKKTATSDDVEMVDQWLGSPSSFRTLKTSHKMISASTEQVPGDFTTLGPKLWSSAVATSFSSSDQSHPPEMKASTAASSSRTLRSD